jgi:UDPglucose--hexose-1-phosphate uridylyltransferase
MENQSQPDVEYSPDQWEMRWHPLRREWVGYAAHRNNRPWQGERVDAGPSAPQHDPECYLCPGNTRNTGIVNPDYEDTFMFDNDFPPFGFDAPAETTGHGIYRSVPATGRCRVVCFHPRHDLTLAEMSVEGVRAVVEAWRTEFQMLSADPRINHVLIFENKGKVVGVSNPHPHGQIYATSFILPTTATEVASCSEHYAEHGRTILQDVLEQETKDKLRIVAENDSCVAFVPYFARWAHEVFVAPRRPVENIAELTASEADDFADVLKTMLVKLDNLYEVSFPYIMAFHSAPTDGGSYPGYHFHIEFHPPLRYPGVMKYLAGAETGGGVFLNDTSPEEKAREFRAASSIHYKSQS